MSLYSADDMRDQHKSSAAKHQQKYIATELAAQEHQNRTNAARQRQRCSANEGGWLTAGWTPHGRAVKTSWS